MKNITFRVSGMNVVASVKEQIVTALVQLTAPEGNCSLHLPLEEAATLNLGSRFTLQLGVPEEPVQP